jgi:hypothetical protein
MKEIKKRVADRNIRELIWKFLRAGVMTKNTYEDTLTGTPQGGIVSPLLANIYLHKLDKYMEENYLNLSHTERKRRRRNGLSNFLYTRYADDWIVLCDGTKEQATHMNGSSPLNQGERCDIRSRNYSRFRFFWSFFLVATAIPLAGRDRGSRTCAASSN